MLGKEKQNIQPNKPTTPRHIRKYSYSEPLTTPPPNPNPLSHIPPNYQAYITQLQKQLSLQKQKSKKIEQHTIREQTKVLEQIDILEKKFMQVENQKREMKALLEESCRDIGEFKRVKGVAEGMVRMMEKVEGRTGDYHEAWRWVKKVVWEYQSIRKKGLQWKKAYDTLKKQQEKPNNTFSNESSQSQSESFSQE